METKFSTEKLKNFLQDSGFTAKELAKRIGVSSAAVSNWVKGKDSPRPRHLLKMALELGVSPQDLRIEALTVPARISFRQKANRKIKEEYKKQIDSSARYLSRLAEYLPETICSNENIRNPHLNYESIQKEASNFRNRNLGIKDNEREVDIYRLVDYLNNSGATLIPVPWGDKKHPVNGIHIAIDNPKSHWLYLNIATPLVDVKFWILHEIAHMLTPDFDMGSDEAEKFADDFAGAVLLPEVFAELIYKQLVLLNNSRMQLQQIKKLSRILIISPYTIYCEVNKYAKQNELPVITLQIGYSISQIVKEVGSLSDSLFTSSEPSAEDYIKVSQKFFNTSIFHALGGYVCDFEKSAGTVARLLNLGMADAVEILAVLREGKYAATENSC